MGLTHSSGLHRGHGAGPGGGGGEEPISGASGITSDVIRRCNCYSLSLDRKCYRHSLTFHPTPGSGGGTGEDSLDSSLGGHGGHHHQHSDSSPGGHHAGFKAGGFVSHAFTSVVNSTASNMGSDKSHSRSGNKKKRYYGFATFKKKLIGKRRWMGVHSKGSDHGRCFREHFVDCCSPVLKALLSQYESLVILKDLNVQANLARPPAPTLSQSLSDLVYSGSCSDLVLCYGPSIRLPAHRDILMARCPFFSRHLPPNATEFHLSTTTQDGANGVCNSDGSGVNGCTLERILAYLYTGNVDLLADVSPEELAPLEDAFGIPPNRLETDVAFLADTGTWSDCRLVFSAGGFGATESVLELSCHKSILAARSGFFRRLLEKKLAKSRRHQSHSVAASDNLNESQDNCEDETARWQRLSGVGPSCEHSDNLDGASEGEVTTLCLDTEIIPAKFGRALLHAMYTDVLDMRLVRDGDQLHPHSVPQYHHPHSSGLVTPPPPHSQLTSPGGAANISGSSLDGEGEDELVRDVKSLYEIGKFLEFSFLCQCCEDLLMQTMAVHNAVDILGWALEPQGSAWIARQAYQYLEEEFYSFSASIELLAKVDKDTLVKVMKSDFTQASESEILQTLIRWGEQQLKMKNKDYLSPNGAMSASTSSTLSRKNAKRRQDGVCDSELKELLAPLFPHVRIQHVLPRDRNSDVMDMAIGRNLFPGGTAHPSNLHVASPLTTASAKFANWDPRNLNGAYVRPRLFLPYFEECKNIIQDRCAQDPEIISSNSPRLGGGVPPDALYMVDGMPRHSQQSSPGHHYRYTSHSYTQSPGVGISRYAGNTPNSLNQPGDPTLLEFHTTKLPDSEMLDRMVLRLEKLLNFVPVQRALALTSNNVYKEEILRLVELRVVRECNLPDNYTNFLRKMRAKQIEQASLGQGPCSYQPAGSDRFSDGFHLGSHSPPSSERRSSSFSSGIMAATAAGSSLGAAAVPDVTLATTSSAAGGRGGGPSSSIATAASFTNLTTNNFGTGGGSSNEMLAGASSASQCASAEQDSPDLVSVDSNRKVYLSAPTANRTKLWGSASPLSGGASSKIFSARANLDPMHHHLPEQATTSMVSNWNQQQQPQQAAFKRLPDALHSLNMSRQQGGYMDEQFYASSQTVLNDMDSSRVASSSSTSTARGRHMQILSRFTSGSQQQHRHQPHHHQASNSSAVLEGSTGGDNVNI